MKKIEKDVIKLYKDSFFSVQQITEKLNLPPFKVRSILDKNLIKRRSIGDAIRYLNITKFNKSIFRVKENLNDNEEKLKIAGVMLYWGEGTKAGGTVTFSNSDPKMVRIFLKFLRKICGISESRVRALLHIYPDHNEKKLKYFWSQITGIPESQFSKTFIHRKSGGSYKNTSEYGTISLRYSDKQLLVIINNWIKDLSNII
ncbi:MAG TPA: hypothetical protein VMD74_00095 [Candidatus Methylomirabilis sp.]|nr:hypothetical protein [Candidatus Methylomirabilis sp.]